MEHLWICVALSCNLHFNHFIFDIQLYFVHFLQENFQKEDEEEEKESSSNKEKLKITA